MNLRKFSAKGIDPISLFLRLGPREKFPAFAMLGEWTVVTWNPDATMSSASKDCFSKLRSFSASSRIPSRSSVPFLGGVIGYISYDAGFLLHRLPLPLGHRALIEAHRYGGAILFRGDEMFIAGEFTSHLEVKKIMERPLPRNDFPSLHLRTKRTRSEYDRAFTRVMRDIRNGEYYQLNLTHRYRAEVSWKPKALFVELLRRNPAPCASYFQGVDRTILSLSPESFVSVQGDTIETSPMKGTRRRGRAEKEDRALATELLADDKEASELNMITDLLRNDVGRVSVPGSVRVTAARALQKNPSVWHTYSTIVGRKQESVSPLDVLIDMFPGGSITGCPKRAAMRAIAEYEADPRGPYTGSFFTLSACGNLRSSILIRTVVLERRSLSLGVGGGIVYDSKAPREWQETLEKAAPFLSLTHGAYQYFAWDRPMPFDDPRIALFDPSNPRARGVFETMRVERGVVSDLALHIARLRLSARCIGMKLPASARRIEACVATVLASSFERARLKIVCTESDVLLSLSPLSSPPPVGTALFVRSERCVPRAKALPYVREWKAHQSAVKKGFDEAILVDSEGFVSEGAYSSIFWVKDGILHSRTTGVLPGITQAKILSEAKRLDISLRITKITPEALLLADEVFMTKSTTGITPIVKVEDVKIGRGRIGAITERLMHILHSSTSRSS